MKILSAAEMQALDRAMVEHYGVASSLLMENAGRAVGDFLIRYYPEETRSGVFVVAGNGNNGGDGFVIGRTLKNAGVPVVVSCLKTVDELKGDARKSAEAYLKAGGQIIELHDRAFGPRDLSELASAGVIVDSLYGTGFRGTLDGVSLSIVETLNAICNTSAVPVVAVDVPSGLDASSGAVNGICVQADVTVSLHSLKPCHVLFPASAFCGEIFVADIGMNNDAEEFTEVKCELLTVHRIQDVLFDSYLVSRDAHKGTRGRVLVIGGSLGYQGAPILSGRAALVCGAGLVALAVPRGMAATVSVVHNELVSLPLADDGGEVLPAGLKQLEQSISSWDALVLGPGLGTSESAKRIVEVTLAQAKREDRPTVIDADALNIIASNPQLRATLPERAVITPHPGEAARLLACSTEQIQNDRLGAASALVEAYGCTVVLKGARTIIAEPGGEIAINPAAVTTLATAGSGDVLAGLVATLLARGANPPDAARAAVFIHGITGELVERASHGPAGSSAASLIEQVGFSLNHILGEGPAERSLVKHVLGFRSSLRPDLAGEEEV